MPIYSVCDWIYLVTCLSNLPQISLFHPAPSLLETSSSILYCSCSSLLSSPLDFYSSPSLFLTTLFSSGFSSISAAASSALFASACCVANSVPSLGMNSCNHLTWWRHRSCWKQGIPAIIQASGCWVSEAFLIYIRKNPTLIQGFLYAMSGASSSSPSGTSSLPASSSPTLWLCFLSLWSFFLHLFFLYIFSLFSFIPSQTSSHRLPFFLVSSLHKIK